MLYSDLLEIKKVLDIDAGDRSEDAKLLFFLSYASSLIAETLNRPDFSYKERTEYYAGTGTQRLLLRYRPVFTDPAIRVWVDDSAYYGSSPTAFTSSNASLTYGTDFCLTIDQPDGTSRSANLVRIKDAWNKPFVRQTGYLTPFLGNGLGNVKVTYTAGYTVDTLPPVFRAATNLLVARMRYLFPLGTEINSESYEDRHILNSNRHRDYFMGMLKPLLWSYRNWKW